VKKEKLWWKEELELQAAMARHPDDPKDMLGQFLLEARSFNKVQPMNNDTTAFLLALDNGNFKVLTDVEDDEQEDNIDDGY
jgi:hypothetical protein